MAKPVSKTNFAISVSTNFLVARLLPKIAADYLTNYVLLYVNGFEGYFSVYGLALTLLIGRLGHGQFSFSTIVVVWMTNDGAIRTDDKIL